MYGAFIGDIVGSKYEFHNIKTKKFPLFSQGCDYTDDTIMTVAVAKAILLSRREQFEKSEMGKGFREFLVEVMQDFGRRYPHPTGAYGGNFAKWLHQAKPKPYGSYGNGSAMRVSPCGLAAVTIEEAQALARASACVTHDHPEGVKGAEAVATAVFLAKAGKSKAEIRQYISEHYYNVDFSLDSIRETYRFDGSCQGSVPQAIVAFLESENFEDAIRNVISIGGDCDTTGAITGSIAWVYYAVQTGRYDGWVYNRFDPSMLEIKKQAMAYLPKEFVKIADEFHEVCWQRAGTYYRVGGCTSILNRKEIKKYWTDWVVPSIQHSAASSDPVTADMEAAMTAFCSKYIVLMKVLYQDKELNQWCRNYSAYRENTTHRELEKMIYEGFVKEAYALGFMPEVLAWKPYSAYSLESALTGTKADLIHGIFVEIRSDYGSNGSLISHAIADGNLYRLMSAWLYPENGQAALEKAEKKPSAGSRYTLDHMMAQEGRPRGQVPGAQSARLDKSLHKWHLQIQLDEKGLWFLSVFVYENGSFDKYSLDREAASDSHYEFQAEQEIRKKLYVSGDENRYFHEIMIRYVKEHGGEALLSLIMPYVTAQFHYD
ncbi:MAG: ADP-ribosylglycohydrolase family protein [Oscillospiraceae bacterium]